MVSACGTQLAQVFGACVGGTLLRVVSMIPGAPRLIMHLHGIDAHPARQPRLVPPHGVDHGVSVGVVGLCLLLILAGRRRKREN